MKKILKSFAAFCLLRMASVMIEIGNIIVAILITAFFLTTRIFDAVIQIITIFKNGVGRIIAALIPEKVTKHAYNTLIKTDDESEL